MGSRLRVHGSTRSWKNPVDITNVRGDVCTHAHQPWTRGRSRRGGGPAPGSGGGAGRCGPGRGSVRAGWRGRRGGLSHPTHTETLDNNLISLFPPLLGCNPFPGFCPKEPKRWLSPRSGREVPGAPPHAAPPAPPLLPIRRRKRVSVTDSYF